MQYTEQKQFDSVSQFGDWLAEQRYQSTKSSTDSGFSDQPFTTYDHALSVARAGGYWEAGARNLQTVDIDAQNATSDTSTRTLVSDVIGAVPNVPAALAGRPHNMFNLRQQVSQRKFLRIGVSVAAGCLVTQQELENRGRAIMAVADALTLQGYSVQVDAVLVLCDSLNPNAVKLSTRLDVRVKPADGQWDAGQVAFALANSSFLRRLGFRFVEAFPSLREMAIGSYGYPADPLEDNDFDVFFPQVTGGRAVKTRASNRDTWSSPDSALAMATELAKDALAKLGRREAA